MLIQSLIIIMLALLVPVTSHATVIKQRPYRFSFEAAAAREDEHFVVCGTCPDNLLTLLPVVPKLAVRLTAPEHVIPEVPEVEHQEGDALHPTGRTATVLFAFDSAHLSRSERAKLSLLVKELPATGTFDRPCFFLPKKFGPLRGRASSSFDFFRPSAALAVRSPVGRLPEVLGI